MKKKKIPENAQAFKDSVIEIDKQPTPGNTTQTKFINFADNTEKKTNSKKKFLIAYLQNTGVGKTDKMIRFFHEDFNQKKRKYSRILYLLPNYPNVNEVIERLQHHWMRSTKSTPVIFKFMGKQKTNNDGKPLCVKAENSKYYPGCGDCEYESDCLWMKQFEQIKTADIVVTVHHCAYIAIKRHFRIVVIDESIEGILFKTFDYTREYWNSLGIEWDIFPKSVKRMCSQHCKMFDGCKNQRPHKECPHHSDIIKMIPFRFREPYDDEEYFIHTVFKKFDIDFDAEKNQITEILGAWSFYRKKPHIAVFDFLPELKCDRIFYLSATTTPEMLKVWFFKNYDQQKWTLEINFDKPAYPNPIVVYKGIGSTRNSIQALKNGVFDNIRVKLGIPKRTKILLVCKKEHKKQFRRRLTRQGIVVDYFPLSGLDKYKNFDVVILAVYFQMNLTTQYLLAEKFNYSMVKRIQDGFTIQALGRIRIGQGHSWLDPKKLLVVYFNFSHDLFPNTISNREGYTKKWIKQQLKLYPKISATRLHQKVTKMNSIYIERDRNKFLKIFKSVKNGFNII